MLNLQAVNHFYGNQHSLWNVDLVLRPGECIGVLGREGMGKTTLVNCIAGHLPVASGRMTWHDIGAPPQDLTPLSAQSRSDGSRRSTGTAAWVMVSGQLVPASTWWCR